MAAPDSSGRAGTGDQHQPCLGTRAETGTALSDRGHRRGTGHPCGTFLAPFARGKGFGGAAGSAVPPCRGLAASPRPRPAALPSPGGRSRAGQGPVGLPREDSPSEAAEKRSRPGRAGLGPPPAAEGPARPRRSPATAASAGMGGPGPERPRRCSLGSSGCARAAPAHGGH